MVEDVIEEIESEYTEHYSYPESGGSLSPTYHAEERWEDRADTEAGLSEAVEDAVPIIWPVPDDYAEARFHMGTVCPLVVADSSIVTVYPSVYEEANYDERPEILEFVREELDKLSDFSEVPDSF